MKKFYAVLFIILVISLSLSVITSHAQSGRLESIETDVAAPGETFSLTISFSIEYPMLVRGGHVVVEIFKAEDLPIDITDEVLAQWEGDFNESGSETITLDIVAISDEGKWPLVATLWCWNEEEWVLLDEVNFNATITSDTQPSSPLGITFDHLMSVCGVVVIGVIGVAAYFINKKGITSTYTKCSHS
jgi:hypothetical protein